MEENKKYEKFETLYEKSIRLINEQYDDYKIIHSKTATLIALSAFVFPLVLSMSNFKEFQICLIWLLIVPIISYLIALIMFCFILFPKDLKYGLGFSKIEEQFNETYLDILKKEIVAIKLAFETNKQIVYKQNLKFKISIGMTLFSIAFLCVIIFIGQIPKFSKSDNSTIQIEHIENFNFLKNKKMDTKDYFLCNGNDEQDNDSASQDSSEESVPNVSLDDLETFTKGDDNEFEEK